MTASHARTAVKVAVQSSRRLLRDSLSACLAVQPDVTVVGKVGEPDAVFELCELRRPDVAILDAGSRLAEISGRVAALTRRFPGLNVIVTYRDASEQDLASACRAGVTSLVPESKGLAAVLALLRRSRGRHAKDSPGGLTDRELELVVLTGSGHSVNEIASLLGISPLTVENLKRRVYAKLDVSSSVHAVAKAASLGMLDDAQTAPTMPLRQTATKAKTAPVAARRPQAESGHGLLAVVSGQHCSALDQVVSALVRSSLPFVLIRKSGPVADTHWARWHRGPIVAVLVDPAPPDWDMVPELGIPAILVHSKPLDPPELAEALACGASSLVPADRIEDHFVSVLRMVGQGYLVVDSMPMRPLIGAVRARWDERSTGGLELPELTARESDILSSLSSGHSIRQTARALGIAPKTVENVQTRLFRKLGVRNRSGALAVADAFGLLPSDTSPGGRRLDSGSEGFRPQPDYPSLPADSWS